MKLWPFRKKEPSRNRDHFELRPWDHESADVPHGWRIGSFDEGMTTVRGMKYHGLRALCGALMNRHSDCDDDMHAFCGPSSISSPTNLIAHISWGYDTEGKSILGITLSRATSDEKFSESNPAATVDELVEHIARFTYSDSTPVSMMVVYQLRNGNYLARYGRMINTVPNNRFVGNVDNEEAIPIYCDPEPQEVKHLYHDETITPGQEGEPEFHCLGINGSWWIVDIDRARGIFALAAGLELADNSNHYGYRWNALRSWEAYCTYVSARKL